MSSGTSVPVRQSRAGCRSPSRSTSPATTTRKTTRTNRLPRADRGVRPEPAAGDVAHAHRQAEPPQRRALRDEDEQRAEVGGEVDDARRRRGLAGTRSRAARPARPPGRRRCPARRCRRRSRSPAGQRPRPGGAGDRRSAARSSAASVARATVQAATATSSDQHQRPEHRVGQQRRAQRAAGGADQGDAGHRQGGAQVGTDPAVVGRPPRPRAADARELVGREHLRPARRPAARAAAPGAGPARRRRRPRRPSRRRPRPAQSSRTSPQLRHRLSAATSSTTASRSAEPVDDGVRVALDVPLLRVGDGAVRHQDGAHADLPSRRGCRRTAGRRRTRRGPGPRRRPRPWRPGTPPGAAWSRGSRWSRPRRRSGRGRRRGGRPPRGARGSTACSTARRSGCRAPAARRSRAGTSGSVSVCGSQKRVVGRQRALVPVDPTARRRRLRKISSRVADRWCSRPARQASSSARQDPGRQLVGVVRVVDLGVAPPLLAQVDRVPGRERAAPVEDDGLDRRRHGRDSADDASPRPRRRRRPRGRRYAGRAPRRRRRPGPSRPRRSSACRAARRP